MQSWQLPEHVADVLPTNARQLESAREQLLTLFRVHGYELVQPPLMEYSHSLLTHIDAGLSLKTILVVDQLSVGSWASAPTLRRKWRVSMRIFCPPIKGLTDCVTQALCCTRGRKVCSICANLCRRERRCMVSPTSGRISN